MQSTWIGGPTHEIKQQHIPGYQGHVAYLKSDAMFGKPFAQITNSCLNKQEGLKEQFKGTMKCEPESFRKQQNTSYYTQEYIKPQQIQSEFVDKSEYQEKELENLLKTKKQLQEQLKQEIENKNKKVTIDNIPPIDRIPIIGYQGYRSVNKKPIREIKQESVEEQKELFMALQEGFQKELLRKDETLRKKIEDKVVPIIGFTGHIHQLVSENQYAHSYRDLVGGCFQKEKNKEIINYNRTQSCQLMPKPNVIFVLGGPGCGKGTQSQYLVKTHHFVHLSAGDLLREEMNRAGSKHGETIKNMIKEGKIVPGELTVELLENAMRKHGWNQKTFLVDGFPRNMDNLSKFEKMLDYLVNVRFVLFFDCSLQEMQSRVMKRAETSGRSDDNLESLQKRFEVFQKETLPIVQYYSQKNKVQTVNANNNIQSIQSNLNLLFSQIQF